MPTERRLLAEVDLDEVVSDSLRMKIIFTLMIVKATAKYSARLDT